MRILPRAVAAAIALPPTLVLALVQFASAPAQAAPVTDPGWDSVDISTDQGLRGLDAVDRDTAWVGGSDGGVWRSTDAGQTWADVSPPDSEGLLFRDVEAHDSERASVLAIGAGAASRIYTTVDAGRTWELAFVNAEPSAFYNCMDFFPGGRRGLAVSDPVDGKFRVLGTRDAGRSWRVLPDAGMPPAVEGEFNFAASGTCLVAMGRRDAWIGTGGAASRVFHTTDAGLHWDVTPSTIPATPAGGVFSLAFRDLQHGVAVGGDFLAPDNGSDASSRTRDGGRSWTGGGDLGGYRSGTDWVADAPQTLVAVGPSGSDISRDGGASWQTFSGTGFDSVVCTDDGGCWASGSDGRVALLRR